MTRLRVAVAGALGRMGSVTCAAINGTDDLELVGGFDRHRAGEPLQVALGLSRPAGRLYADIASLYDEVKPEVVVDFTVYPVTLEVAGTAIERGISPVIGATGWTPADRDVFAARCDARGIGAALVPNFAVGAVLMMRFAAQAAAFFPTAEIIELHHDRKIDKPSGTAKLTAERMAERAGKEVPIQSVRLRGLVAHQEVLFGGEGEILTIRHDSLSRESFMSGVLKVVRGVRARNGFTLGLDSFLEGVSCG
jgi:4-hydroxy-tetrahydrodipicolinate reductase